MVFKSTAKGIKYLVDSYNQNPKFKAITNTIGVYTGLKVAGDLIGIKSSELEQICDMSAPVISGIYGSLQIDDDRVVSNHSLKSIIKVGIASIVGWDLADKLSDYSGSNEGLESLRDAYLKTHYYIAENFSEWYEKESTGFLFGLIFGSFNRIKYHYNKLNSQNQHHP